MTMEFLEPDRDQIEIFADALFRYAGTRGFVSLRGFYEDDSAKPFRISPVPLTGGLKFVTKRAFDDAHRAANAPKSVVFCPPIAIFENDRKAGEKDIVAGLALSVELDQHPQRARDELTRLLGAPTLVVRSGGRWIDPATGVEHDKLHIHWRLAKPATRATLADLKSRARSRGPPGRRRPVEQAGLPPNSLGRQLASQGRAAPVRDRRAGSRSGDRSRHRPGGPARRVPRRQEAQRRRRRMDRRGRKRRRGRLDGAVRQRLKRGKPARLAGRPRHEATTVRHERRRRGEPDARRDDGVNSAA